MKLITFSRISKQDDRDIIPGIQRQRDDCRSIAQDRQEGEVAGHLARGCHRRHILDHDHGRGGDHRLN